MSSWTYLKKYLKPEIKYLVYIFFNVVIYVLTFLLIPLVFGFIIDNLLKQEPVSGKVIIWLSSLLGGVDYLRHHLGIIFLVVVVLSIINALFSYLKGKYSAYVSERINEKMRNDLYSHLQYLPYSFHQKNKSGELIQKCTSDVEQIRHFFSHQAADMVYSLTMTIASILIMISINKELMYICILSMPLIIIIALWFFKRMQKIFLASDEAEGEMLNVLQENLQGNRVVKAFNREISQAKRFDEHIEVFNEKTFKVIKLLGLYWSLTDALCLLQILVTVFFGIQFAASGKITTGEFYVFVTYEMSVLWPIRMLGRIIADMGKMFVSANRLAEIIDTKAEDLKEGIEPDLNGDIVFSDVHFKFDDGDTDALKGINLKIPTNKTTAIMGPIGSGKSTLVHLLCRLYDFQSGSITINSYDLKKIAKGYLRKNIGIVLQEPFLFSKTIEENITISSPEAGYKEMEIAAKIASVHDVISSFDRGYRTMVGERGVTLSGGQKQRISIARVIINDVKVLIFDDSLSAVDSETDKSIRKALNELAKGMTTIIITHRCDSAFLADNIVVLENGKISQSGTHKSLIKQKGFYQDIYNLQKLQGDK